MSTASRITWVTGKQRRARSKKMALLNQDFKNARVLGPSSLAVLHYCVFHLMLMFLASLCSFFTPLFSREREREEREKERERKSDTQGWEIPEKTRYKSKCISALCGARSSRGLGHIHILRMASGGGRKGEVTGSL